VTRLERPEPARMVRTGDNDPQGGKRKVAPASLLQAAAHRLYVKGVRRAHLLVGEEAFRGDERLNCSHTSTRLATIFPVKKKKQKKEKNKHEKNKGG